ncbi:MAG: hypothetical protein F6J93_19360 [Oscillatoria sp. SIO1A7]|nr:hypothetical protein [Oscillatoria sp. SIO1A7]
MGIGHGALGIGHGALGEGDRGTWGHGDQIKVKSQKSKVKSEETREHFNFVRCRLLTSSLHPTPYTLHPTP